ncbi:MAG: Ig-like domain-containing protein [Anaeromyxobacter sp.]
MAFHDLKPHHAAALLALTLAACAGSSDPTLQSLAIGDGTSYAEVGVLKQLPLTGQFSDGASKPITGGVTWTSSDPSLAAVDANGVMSPWTDGTVQITATHTATGLTATAEVVTRRFTAVPADAALVSGQVDTGAAYFHVSGLTPGMMYVPAAFGMTDDVDLLVYPDISMTRGTELCASFSVGRFDDWCIAPATGTGELWVTVDGQWTGHGASFDLDVPAAPEVAAALTLGLAEVPYAGAIGSNRQVVKVTGLAPGAAYEVRLSGLTADVDLEVYADRYKYDSLCESFVSGTSDDACDATAGESGELYLELDGESSAEGGDYTLSLTAR